MKTVQFLNYFEARSELMLEFIRRLCEIESPSHDEAGSRVAVALLESNAKELKCVNRAEKIAAAGYGEHLIIRAFSESKEKPILLLGHTDTVHPRGSLTARPFKIDGERAFAPGIFDMKSGCVLMLEVLRAFDNLEVKPQRPIVILLSCDEEVGSPTGREIVEREAREAAFCLVFEPSANGKAKTGRKGTATYTLKAHGVPAHAGLEPEKGASAILESARQILKIQALNKPDIGTTVNVCRISGGTATNVIPADAECEIDVRFSSMPEATRIETEIKSLQSFDERVNLEIVGEINRPPLERTAAVAALFERARQIAAEFDYELGETAVGGASDGNFVGALKVPVLDGLGVAGDGAHTRHEHILVSDIPRRATLLARLIASL